MTGHDIFTAMGNIDRRFILESAPERRRKGILSPAARRTLIAACLCLILCSSVIVVFLMSGHVPTVNGAMFSAEEIEKIMHRDTMGVSTNAYQKIRVKSPEELRIYKIPETEYIPIYDTKLSELNEDELLKLANCIIPKFEDLFDCELECYDEYHDTTFTDSIVIKYQSKKENRKDSQLKIEIEQRQDYYNISFDYSNYQYKKDAVPLKLDGKDLISNADMSEEERYASHSVVRDIFCELFGIELPYHDFRTRGSTFYNGITHPTENYSKVYSEDYYNYDNFLTIYGGISHQYDVNMDLRIFRKNTEDYCPEIARTKMLTLEEAEELLYKGYVFGGHTCKLCMAEQAKVDFEGYDYVGLEYVFGKDNNYYDTVGVPFYVFYKLIETEELETHTVYTYAKTYVPAVKVSGLDEYFELQKEKHPKDGEYY